MNLSRTNNGRENKRRAIFATAFFLVMVSGIMRTAMGATVEEEKEAERIRRQKIEKLEALAAASRQTPPEEAEEESAGPLEGERDRTMTAFLLLEERREALKEASGDEKKILKAELKQLERELLNVPQRDRFSFGGDFDMTYDNNIDRNVIRSEEGDTLFQLIPFVELDWGMKKTDFKVEFRGVRKYYVKVPEGKDVSNLEALIRAGRKIGKKTTLSLNDRLNFQFQRDPDIDDDGRKVTIDNSHQAALNFQVNRKLALNFETSYARQDFPHELFDQDTNETFSLDPNGVFQLTPKTRLSAGYRVTLTRSKTETSDKTEHQFRVGYFGQMTGKSSLQLDFSHTLGDPDSAQASRSDQTDTSIGYIWQATPKTSLRLLYSNSFTHSISDSVSSGALLKTTTRTSSDSFSVSIRLRPLRKLSTDFSSDISHSHTKTRKTGSANTRSRQWTFPFQVALDYQLLEGVRLRFSYTYRHRIGNEESDEHRAHTWFLGTNVSF